MNASVEEIIEKHRKSGSFVEMGDLTVFNLDQGKGEVVLMIHGVPSSSYLYRKFMGPLEQAGYRGLAVDFPGLGLSARPQDYDYSWSGLTRFLNEYLKEKKINKFHLVVHDIGGPVGLMLAAQNQDKVKSLTILNTVLYASKFERPWSMEPFAIPTLGEIYLATAGRFMLYLMFQMLAIKDSAKVSREEIYAYADLLKGTDNGAAFLQIMRSFERTPEVEEQCIAAVTSDKYDIQCIWGEDDPALKVSEFGKDFREKARLKAFHQVPGKHFFQEDQYDKILALLIPFLKAA